MFPVHDANSLLGRKWCYCLRYNLAAFRVWLGVLIKVPSGKLDELL